ncbi:hypothetical protein COO91_10272 (plasmid) [Nostoc flagelliforme CCNUN1]|uniref:Uncharacterized protein n=1 Tax=Nostoc flagelliforme CCNUN1 TaxID=2038116 RepID=A0A2K8T8M9_9NOSO|nr:hypothetical protein [Nostoc flagelliforme]AUB44056.1 hypothetical protein COO91_10272 [Nostoc flagelliforme CCNUN1]
MTDKLDLAPEKVRIKDSYRERIFAESQQIGKSYLETLYFIIDCYFVFIKAGLPPQQGSFTPINTDQNKPQQPTTLASPDSKPEDPDGETFSLDFDL